jgi:hypothetical protein
VAILQAAAVFMIVHAPLAAGYYVSKEDAPWLNKHASQPSANVEGVPDERIVTCWHLRQMHGEEGKTLPSRRRSQVL